MVPLSRRLLLATAAAGLAAPARAAEGSLRPALLRCEHLIDPRGIALGEEGRGPPRLSWACAATRDAAGLRQTAYRIVVASEPEGLVAPDLWDSGKVGTDGTVLVPYGGRALRSGQACHWTVFVWDQDGVMSAPAPAASWTMGLAPQDWDAAWIGLHDDAPATLDASWIVYARPDLASPESGHVQYFRRDFVLAEAAGPGAGAVALAVDGEAAVFLDGAWVGAAGARDTTTRLDLPALAPGAHVLAVTVGRAARPPALAARVEIAGTEGGIVAFGTDAGWRAADWVLPDWKRPGFDATGWDTARVVGPATEVLDHPVQSGPAVWLRRDFALDRPVRRATAYLSGLGWSELWVNGARAGDAVLSPGLADYARRAPFVTLEIAALLRPGANALGVVLGQGRLRAPRPLARDFGPPCLRLHLDVAFADGTTLRVASAPDWQGTDAGPIRANNEYDGETYDARAETPGWSEPGFDARGWRAAGTVAGPGGAMTAAMAEPSRVLAILPPVRVTTLPSGRVFDFGRTIAGVCRLRADGPRGAEIVLRHAERLHADGTLDTANLRSARATDRVVLDGRGPRVVQPRFTTHGFRYAALSGSATATLEAVEVGDDLRRIGRFACSDPVLNRIHAAIVATVQANCRSIRTDCPQRDERQGWLGDPAEECRGEAMMFGNAAFYAKWLGDIADTQRPDGSLSDVAPAYWPVYTDDIAWPAAFLAIPGMLLDHHGDDAPLRRHYPAMERWVAHLAEAAGPHDHYGDWRAPPEDRGATHPREAPTSGALIAAAYHVRCLDLMARYAGVLGRDPARFAAEAAARREDFQRRFLATVLGPVPGLGTGDATSAILALAFDLVPAGSRGAAGARLVATIEAAGRHPCFGLVGAQWVNRVLTGLGRADLAHAMAVDPSYPGLGYMIAQGATTLWELWNGDTADPAMSSGDHTMLMGDLPAWLYHHVAGLAPDPARPGFAHVLIAPARIPALAWAEAEHLSPRGRIAVRWERTAERLALECEVPPNVSATVVLPGVVPGEVGSGRHRFVVST